MIALDSFSSGEEVLIRAGLAALVEVGYDLSILNAVVKAELPLKLSGMTWQHDTILIGEMGLVSQAAVNCVLEEELLHLQQKARGLFHQIGRTTVDCLEDDIDAVRKFPLPEPPDQGHD